MKIIASVLILLTVLTICAGELDRSRGGEGSPVVVTLLFATLAWGLLLALKVLVA